MDHFSYISDHSERLDIFLSRSHPELSRSFISKAICSGKVLVNNTIAKPSLKLKTTDTIKVDTLALRTDRPMPIDLPVLYEDDLCIVINKPSGTITHAKGQLSNEPSVASFIRDRIDPALTGNRAGIVHRLDRGTSGVIITAKTAETQKYFQRQFAKRQVKKTYVTLVADKMSRSKALINMPIERHPRAPSTFRSGANGKPAQTYYEVVQENDQYSLLKLKPVTGRTHQLRVHLKAIERPIVGDSLYGGERADRLMLHALELEVILPDIGRKRFSAPIPVEFSQYMAQK